MTEVGSKKRGTGAKALRMLLDIFSCLFAEFRPRWPDLVFSENPVLQNFKWTLLIFKHLLLFNN